MFFWIMIKMLNKDFDFLCRFLSRVLLDNVCRHACCWIKGGAHVSLSAATVTNKKLTAKND